MKIYKPDERGLVTLRVFILALSLFFAGAARYYIPVDTITIIVLLAIVTADIFIMFIYLPFYFGSLSYETDNDEIIKHSGVFIKKHQSVRYGSVQYTAVLTTPFAQYTGLNFVVLFVYGGQMPLMFLRQSDAMEILKHTKASDFGEV